MIFDFFRFVKYGKLICTPNGKLNTQLPITHICSRKKVYLRGPFHFVLILSYSLVSKNSCMLILSQSRLDSRIRLQDCPVVSDPKYEITVPWSKSAIKPTIDLLELPPDIFIVHFMTQLFG